MQERALAVPVDDGWGAAASEAGARVIRGRLLKFADWRWSAGKEAEAIEDGTQLVALSTVAAWVRWEGGKPVEYRTREPGRRLPDRNEIGHLEEATWEQGPGGGPRDPWQQTRMVYLADPGTGELFTFSTSSGGGRNAVIDLADNIARMRFAHPRAVPLIELRSAEMKTKFGNKSRPVFKIVGWKGASDAAEQATSEPQLLAAGTSARRAMDDEIPF
jgi:hypothetical protein